MYVNYIDCKPINIHCVFILSLREPLGLNCNRKWICIHNARSTSKQHANISHWNSSNMHSSCTQLLQVSRITHCCSLTTFLRLCVEYHFCSNSCWKFPVYNCGAAETGCVQCTHFLCAYRACSAYIMARKHTRGWIGQGQLHCKTTGGSGGNDPACGNQCCLHTYFSSLNWKKAKENKKKNNSVVYPMHKPYFSIE